MSQSPKFGLILLFDSLPTPPEEEGGVEAVVAPAGDDEDTLPDYGPRSGFGFLPAPPGARSQASFFAPADHSAQAVLAQPDPARASPDSGSGSGAGAETAEATDWAPQPHYFDIIETDSGFLADCRLDEHAFRLIGFDLPAPSGTTERPIRCSHWRHDQKRALKAHRAHIVCIYESGSSDSTEQLIAFYRLAGHYLNQGLIGLIDEDAWNCVPAALIADEIAPENLAVIRDDMPMGLWTGFVKFKRRAGGIWYCTKGFHRWGLSDFAYLGQADEARATYEMFWALFDFLRVSGQPIGVGHKAELGRERLAFREVTEYRDQLIGPAGTLVIEKQVGREL